jgi:hypothetical protein
MAGAAVIAAVANALGNRDFPFVFGGDGASFAVSPADSAAARTALADASVCPSILGPAAKPKSELYLDTLRSPRPKPG